LKNSQRWLKTVKTELDALSHVTSKGASTGGLMEFVQVFFETSENMWKERAKPRWAQQSLRLYGGKKRVFANFFNQISKGDDKNVVIAYGSAKFASTGPREVAVPTTRAFKECSIRFNTHVVNEWRSTKISCEDDSILQRVARRSEGRLVDVRGLLWRGSANNIQGKLINRDLNAALNIRRCFLLPERPAILDPILHVGERIVQVVKRIIKNKKMMRGQMGVRRLRRL